MKKKIKLMNKIAKVGTDVFDRDLFEVSDDIEAPDAIMVRSAALHDMPLNAELLAIARCGAGVNNIPLDKCAENGIVVFNTPGANANGVKELTIAALLLASRNIVGGIEWAKSLEGTEGIEKAVEKGKSAYAGTELAGKTLGVIGLGAIGGMVANTATHMGMKVIGCDPYITVNAAWSLSRSIEKAADYNEIYRRADYITLHVPATPTTKNMINKDTLAMMKDGVKIINLSRADLVNAQDIKAAIECGKVSAYVTDFPTAETIGVKGITCIPHLGASTEESEENCAVMAAHELEDYITTGNIRNSVNFPSLSIPHTGASRICLIHKNIPNMLSQITNAISEQNINIENMVNGAKGEYAYTMVETTSPVPSSVSDKFSEIDGMVRVRIIL
ncbi:MAG: phosphoglycerate dehydrogenase [Eubacteriales bacterium]|nr:phosphoglycerate dehydrogenase [Eubacteriales bacterium]